MNLKELQDKKKAITEPFDLLMSEIENWPNKTEVPREKLTELGVLAEQKSSPETQRLTENLDLQIKLATQHNHQFRLALLQLLWNEIQFQFQSLVVEEQKYKAKWWSGWPITEALRVAKQGYDDDRKRQDFKDRELRYRIDRLKQSVAELKACDSFHTDLEKDISNLLATLDSETTAGAQANSDPVSAMENMVSIQNPVLKLRCVELCQKARAKEDQLNNEFKKQDENGVTEKTLKLNQLPKMADAETRKHERLILEAREPRLLNSVALVDRSGESPSVVITDGPSRVISSVVRSQQNAVQPTPVSTRTLNGETVRKAIADLYGCTIDPLTTEALKIAIKKEMGLWFTRTWFRPLEYKTVKKILQAAEYPETLKEADFIHMQRRIDRLKKFPRFANEVSRSDRLRMEAAFKQVGAEISQARDVSSLMEIATTTDQRNFANTVKNREAELATYKSQITAAEEKLPDALEISAIEEKELSKKSLPELQTYATYIFQENLAKVLPSNQRVEVHAYRPSQALLESLELVKNSKSLYFVVLILSMALNRTQKTGYDYEVLQQLLMDILDGKYNETMFEPEDDEFNIGASQFKSELKTTLSDVGMEWLIAYFPDAIASSNDAQFLKTDLLNEFPGPENKYSESIEIVRSLSDERKNSAEVKNVSSELDQKLANVDENGYIEVLASYVKRMQDTGVRVIKSTIKDIVKQFADDNQDEIFKRHFNDYPQAPKSVLLLYSLLTWFCLDKQDEAGQSKEDATKFRDRCHAPRKDIEQWLASWRRDSQASSQPESISILLTNKKELPSLDADAASFKSDKNDLKNNLYRKKIANIRRWTSADELVNIVYELFPNKIISPRERIANVNVSSSSRAASVSPAPAAVKREQAVVTPAMYQEDQVYLKKVRDTWAGAINSRETSNVESFLRKNLSYYKAADRDVLGIYTLLQWYMTTVRGIMIFGEKRPDELVDQQFRASYKKLLTRFECAVKRSEKISEKEIVDLLVHCQSPKKEPYKDSVSLKRLFVRINETLAPSVSMASVSVKASPATTPTRNSVAASRAAVTPIKESSFDFQLGEGARRYLNQEEEKAVSPARGSFFLLRPSAVTTPVISTPVRRTSVSSQVGSPMPACDLRSAMAGNSTDAADYAIVPSDDSVADSPPEIISAKKTISESNIVSASPSRISISISRSISFALGSPGAQQGSYSSVPTVANGPSAHASFRFPFASPNSKGAVVVSHEERVEVMANSVKAAIGNIDERLTNAKLELVYEEAKIQLGKFKDPGESAELGAAQKLSCILSWYGKKYPSLVIEKNVGEFQRKVEERQNKEFKVVDKVTDSVKAYLLSGTPISLEKIEGHVSAEFKNLQEIIEHYISKIEEAQVASTSVSSMKSG